MTALMNEVEMGARCADILRRCQYANIATCHDDQPWNTPVTAVSDSDLNLYWSSWVRARHSHNIAHNPRVFLTFYDSTRKRGTNNRRGLYLRCQAEAISDKSEAEKAHALLYPDEPVSLGDFMGTGLRRFYRAQPLQAWLNVLSERQLQTDTEKMRSEVPLDVIRSALGAMHP